MTWNIYKMYKLINQKCKTISVIKNHIFTYGRVQEVFNPFQTMG